MSINVTVTGNPVSIKRGKMITTSQPEVAKKDYDQRRLMRLEQVRKQSKELAQDVRNKVRQEKKKQRGEIEKEGKEKLKSWQNQKLLELQNQYLGALRDMGLGHKEAEKYADESEILEVQQQENEEVAKNRGKLAEAKQQIKKNEENFKKALPIQHKKIVRDVENTRAALVSTLGKYNQKKSNNKEKTKTKKPTEANINISIPNDSDFSEASSSSDSSNRIQQESNNVSEQSDSEGFCECPKEKLIEAEVHQENSDSDSEPFRFSSKLDLESRESSKQKKSHKDSLDEQRKIIENFRNRTREVPVDTRISDRIKRRELMASQPDYCDIVADPTPVNEVDEITKVRDKISARSAPSTKDPLELSAESVGCVNTKSHNCCPCNPQEPVATTANRKTCKCKPECKFKQGQDPSSKAETVISGSSGAYKVRSSDYSTRLQDEIPTKPPVRLKSAGQQTSKVDTMQSSARQASKFSKATEEPKRFIQATKPPSTASSTSGAQKVRQYDHPNRFIREVPSTSHVEKISADSIEVLPNITSEREWHEKMKQRDIEAQIRGKRAMEKKKVQRDYEEMMKKLPMLQRRRQIAEIGTDKPEYHMSEERLRERERERQNRLENAYTQAIPELRPQIVTLPSRQHDIPMTDQPFEILDGSDSRVLNLGKWDTDSRPKTMFSAEEVQEIIKAFTVQKPEDRKKKLKHRLKSLKLQKEQLINAIRALPADDSINALLGDLTSLSDSDEQGHRSNKPKTKDKDKSERKRRREESETSSSNSDASQDKKKDDEKKSKHKDKKYRTPQKKSRKRDYKVRILQNMSTQTTPKSSTTSSTTTSTTTSTSTSSVQESELPKICPKSRAPCECVNHPCEKKDSEEVCKILIKLSEEDSPKVEVVKGAPYADKEKRKKDEEVEKVQKPPEKKKEKSSKSPKKSKQSQSKDKENIPQKEPMKRPEIKPVSTTEEQLFKKPFPKPLKKTTLEKEKKTSPKRKTESWREHFSKNSTSSTSYLGRPDFSRIDSTASTDTSKQSEFYSKKKPQQRNTERSMKATPGEDSQIDPRLLQYVKRLLAMSKNSVDELGVSTSDVQTPSQSIIEMESNNPMAHINDIMNFIIAQSTIARQLNSSDDLVHAPPNSSVDHSDKSNIIEDQNVTPQVPDKDSKIKERLLTQYADVTDSATQRIANLAAMIQKLRQEKIELLQSPPLSQTENSPRQDLAPPSPTSDKDNSSTQYLQFPPAGEKSRGANSTDSMEEDELNRVLLNIDMKLAKKLRHYAMVNSPKKNLPEESHSTQTESIRPTSEDSSNQTDQQFLQRLQNLIQESNHRQEPDEEDVNNHLPEINKEVPFIPFLVDIPKLPILEPEPEGFDNSVPTKRHPPPSKGLIVAKKFNGDISLMMPHELSTIVEVDSLISAKISPNNSKVAISKDFVAPLSPTIEEPTDKSVIEKSIAPSSISSASPACKADTCQSFAFSSSASQVTSTSSSGELRSMEDMLKSIGMDWAVSTVQKTKEALALSSSSTSADLSSTKKSNNSQKSPSNTEVSLKEFLKKQMNSKISSSSMKSEASPASFVRECSELSVIQANSSTDKAKQQRTSTPVLSKTSSKDDQPQFFNGASDISSVRNNSSTDDQGKIGKVTFQSLPGDEESTSLTKSSVG